MRVDYYGFPSIDPYRECEGEEAQHDEREYGRAKSYEDILLRIDRLLGYIGYSFNGQEKPNGERDGRKGARPAIGQWIAGEVGYFEAICGSEKEEDQTQDC